MLRTLLTALRGLVWGRPNVARPSEQLAVLTHAMTDDATVRSLTSMTPSEGRPAMNAAYEKLIQHLDEREVRYLTNGESRSICADFRCDVGTYGRNPILPRDASSGGVSLVWGEQVGETASLRPGILTALQGDKDG